MWQVLQLLEDIFYPVRCLRCKKTLRECALFCPSCHAQFRDRRFLYPHSYKCDALEGICLLFRYDEELKDALHRVKFSGQKRLLPLLAKELLCECYSVEFTECWSLPEKLFLTAIPTDAQRRKQRGCDIPTEIFEPWGRREGFVWLEALERSRPTHPQYGLNKKERQQNVKNCFRARLRLHGETIFLVDDIFTSGATMGEAARVLKQAGAGAVYGVALCGGAIL